MKKILFNLIYFFVYMAAQAQPNLFGLTSNGDGASAGGTIINFLPLTNTATSAKKFSLPGNRPSYNVLVQATNGNFYGMTSQGGANGLGVLFSFNPITQQYSLLHEFKGGVTDGASPYDGLCQANSGLLYGMTYEGGTSNAGVIFSFNPTNNSIAVLHNFSAGNTDGGYPIGNLIQAGNGLLYGTAQTGGNFGAGTIFSFNPSNNALVVLHHFNVSDGGGPWSTLLLAGDGNMYGLTTNGGAAGAGVIFSYSPSNNSYTVLHNFIGGTTDGSNPYSHSLAQDASGNIYGTTTQGGTAGEGIIFKYNPANSIYSVIHSFTGGANDGAYPFSGLIQASNGLLYGVTESGGFNAGVIYSLDPSGNQLTIIHSFTTGTTDGGYPQGDFAKGTDGKLYGMSYLGGVASLGCIFSLDPSTNSFAFLLAFDNLADSGFSPLGSLVQASDGNLYGMTYLGGNSGGYGVIFSYNPNNNGYTVLHNFSGNNADGAYPYGGLIQASDGLLYGMTSQGGTGNVGTIFSYNPSSNSYTLLHNFVGNLTDGGYPLADLVQGSDGNLYGTTSNGGAFGAGVIFSFNPSSNLFTLLHSFNTSTDGYLPRSTLIQASDGNLYGTTQFGAANNSGTIFAYNPSNGNYSVVHNFSGGVSDGANPVCGVIQASDGNLYGLTPQGGTNNQGAAFSYNPSNSAYSILHNFENTNDGYYPYGGFTQASDGILYGMTTYGANSLGTIFSYNISTAAYSVVYNLNATTGYNPQYSTFIDLNQIKIATSSLSATAYCQGSNLQVPFTTKGSFNNGNIFTAQLSDANGSFSVPINIGNLSSANAGTINATIPANTPEGTHYRIRVISSTPVIKTDIGKTIIVNAVSVAGSISGAAPVCSGNNITTLTLSGNTGTIKWQSSPGNQEEDFTNISSATDPALTLNNLIATTYYQAVVTNGACASVNSGIVAINVNEPTITFYQDYDGDGYGNPQVTMVACTAPTGYVANNTDCDDHNAAIHAQFGFYIDADGDGYGTGTLVNVCAADANTPPAGYSINNTDCDDNNINIHGKFAFYTDADGDGYGTGSLVNVCAADANTPPTGYSTNNTDCDDHNAAVHAQFAFYTDADGDGFGAGSPVNVCAVDANTPPAGYSTNNTDPDDGNGAVHAQFAFYKDDDGDGYGAGDLVNVAAVDANTPPTGYSTNNADCDDGNGAIHAQFAFYKDNDGDGYGTGSLVNVCAVDANTAPTGYCTNNTDCDDGKSSAWQSGLLYIDGDGDGYDNGQAVVCYGSNAPAGYSLTTRGTDCNDNDPSINATPAAGTISGAAPVCFGGAIKLTLSGSTGNIQWQTSSDNLTFTNISGANGAILNVTGLSATTYFQAVLNNGTCITTTSSVTVVVNPMPLATIATSPAVMAGSTGNMASVVNAGTGTTYAWTISNGTITAGAGTNGISFTAGSSGSVTLSVTVTNSFQCSLSSGSTQVSITTLSCPAVTVAAQSSVCSGSTGNVASVSSGGPGASYLWTISNGTITSGNNTSHIIYTAGTSGSVTIAVAVTNKSGCKAISPNKAIAINALPAATITSATTVCGNSIGNIASVASAGTGASYLWTISNGTLISNKTSRIILFIAGTSGNVTLSVTVTNSSGCKSTSANKIITINAAPVATITAPVSVCSASTGNIASVTNAGTGASYSWSISNGSITSGSNANSITFKAGNSGITLVDVIITNKNGCAAIAVPKQVNILPIPAAVISAASPVCGSSTSNSASVANAGKGASYSWTISNGTINSGIGTNTISYKAGTSGSVILSVTVTNSGGCKASSANKVVPVKSTVTPSFTQIAALCLNAKAPTLPSISNNGVSGSWSPSKISTSSVSSTLYTFTPSAGQCASTITMKIEVQKCNNNVAKTSVVQTIQEASAETVEPHLDARLQPNPTETAFTLIIKGTRKEIAEIRVFDMLGRSLDHLRARTGESVQFGTQYAPGTYIIEVIQGPERKVLKGLKQ